MTQIKLNEFLINNAERLKEMITGGTIYFDVLSKGAYYSVIISPYRYDETVHKDNFLEILQIKHPAKKAFSCESSIPYIFEIGLFATLLTVLGYEVMYPNRNRNNFPDPFEFRDEQSDCSYSSYSEALQIAIAERKFGSNSLDKILGGEKIGARPEITNDFPTKMGLRKPLSPEELD